jgi:hypothetical protein
MLRLTKDNCPLYLQKSDFFLTSLSENVEFVISVGKGNCKENDDVKSIYDLIHLLKTCDYFGLDISLLKNIEDFIHRSDKKEIINILYTLSNLGNVRRLLQQLNDSLCSFTIEIVPFSPLNEIAEAPFLISIKSYIKDKLVGWMNVIYGEGLPINSPFSDVLDIKREKIILIRKMSYINEYFTIKMEDNKLKFTLLKTTESLEEISFSYCDLVVVSSIHIYINKWNRREVEKVLNDFNKAYDEFYQSKQRAIAEEYKRYNT